MGETGAGGGRGEKEDDDDGNEVNGDVLQWRAATGTGAELTLAGYNWDVSRVVMSKWWAGWVAKRTDGRCDFPLVLLSCPRQMAISRVDKGCKRKSSQSG